MNRLLAPILVSVALSAVSGMSSGQAGVVDPLEQECKKLERQSMHEPEVTLCSAEPSGDTCQPDTRNHVFTLELLRSLKSLDFTKRCLWVKRNVCSKNFGVKEIYRPVTTHDDRLMEINPHRRSDVGLCPGHGFEFYVGRNPMVSAPGAPIGTTADELRKDNKSAFSAKAPLNWHALCAQSEGKLSETSKVVGQFPHAGEPLLRPTRLRHFDQPGQTLSVFFDCQTVPPIPPPPPASQPCPATGPCPIKSDSDAGTVASSVAAGVGAGLLLSRLLREGGPLRPLPPAPAARDTLRTRVRLDIARARGDSRAGTDIPGDEG